MVVSWFTSHPLPGPPSPSQPPRSHLIDNRGPLSSGPFHERHTANRTEKDCSQDQIVISLILLTLKMSPSLPARRMFSGGWCQSYWWLVRDYQQLILAFPLPALFILTSRPCPNSIRPVRREDQALWRCLGIRHESIDSAIK